MVSTSRETIPPDSPGVPYREEEPTVAAGEELLTLLGDPYTRCVIAAMGEQARTGTELIERTGVSKATVYRRLDELQDAGLVTTSIRIDPDGHHCKEYRRTVDGLSVSLDDSGIEVTVSERSDGSRDRSCDERLLRAGRSSSTSSSSSTGSTGT